MTTTTRRPPPTTTQAAGGDGGCGSGTTSWACDEINSGIQHGYLPEDYDPDADATADELEEILDTYGEHNPDFDADAAIETLPETGDADRGDMFIALAIGLGIDVDPADDPFEVADELADMGILLGLDGDGDGVANPYHRPDADPDSTMTNSELAAFLDRIPSPEDSNDGDGSSTVHRPGGGGSPGGGGGGGGGGGSPGGGGGGPPSGDADGDDQMCTTGLLLSRGERSRFGSQLIWHTLVGVERQGEPGRPWPPHPDVPGGAEYLVVSGSPVWPVIDPGASWYVASDDGCLWVAISVQTRLMQLLPWRASHRSTIENAHTVRPEAGLDAYLRRWDNLSADQQAQAQRHHRNRNVRASCAIATAMIAADAYDRCRWELPTSGVWSWQVRACFEGIGADATFHEGATLASGVEWFLGIIDYTSGLTLHNQPAS